MLHAKYLSTSPCGFREEDFFKFHYMHIRKTNDPRGRANFDPRGIIGTILVEVHSMMLHAKYLSLGFVVSEKIFNVFLSVAMATRVLHGMEFFEQL